MEATNLLCSEFFKLESHITSECCLQSHLKYIVFMFFKGSGSSRGMVRIHFLTV